MSTEEIISRKEVKENKLRAISMGQEGYWGNPCKRGHSGWMTLCSDGVGRCKECRQITFKKWSATNATHKKAYAKADRDKNRELYKKYDKIRYESIKNTPEYKHRKTTYNSERYANDPEHRTIILCRAMLNRILKATNQTKRTRTTNLLKYTNKDLLNHIERLFLSGMTWDNFGDWHIDHIYPVSRYIKDGVEDPAVINHLDNLIPMWDEHNLEKSDRTLEEYLDDRKDLVELYGRFL